MQKLTKLNQLRKGDEYLLEYYSVSLGDVLDGKPKVINNYLKLTYLGKPKGRHRFKATTSKDGSFWEFTKEDIFKQIYFN